VETPSCGTASKLSRAALAGDAARLTASRAAKVCLNMIDFP
jgi:hypothetical protein